MLYGLVITVHVIVSLILIAVILLQAGRGGGLSESFGGSQTQTILGTKTSLFLKRATAVRRSAETPLRRRSWPVNKAARNMALSRGRRAEDLSIWDGGSFFIVGLGTRRVLP